MPGSGCSERVHLARPPHPPMFPGNLLGPMRRSRLDRMCQVKCRSIRITKAESTDHLTNTITKLCLACVQVIFPMKYLGHSLISVKFKITRGLEIKNLKMLSLLACLFEVNCDEDQTPGMGPPQCECHAYLPLNTSTEHSRE